jgi:antitoxin ChpS
MDAEVRLRAKNQITLPDAIVRRLGLEPGDRLVLEIDDEQPDRVELRPIRRSYAGILAGVFGTDDEAVAYVRGERASWPE